MARVSKGKFRYLRDTYAAQSYFTITAKNIESMKLMLGDDIKVGERYIMRPMKMSDELIAALDSPRKFADARKLGAAIENPTLKKLLTQHQRTWAAHPVEVSEGSVLADVATKNLTNRLVGEVSAGIDEAFAPKEV